MAFKIQIYTEFKGWVNNQMTVINDIRTRDIIASRVFAQIELYWYLLTKNFSDIVQGKIGKGSCIIHIYMNECSTVLLHITVIQAINLPFI